MQPQYLYGIQCDTSLSFPGIHFVEHHSQPGAWRILGTMRDLETQKSKIFVYMRAGGQLEKPREWHIDHIVEGHHYADVDITGNLPNSYDTVLPCVLLYNPHEHASKTPTMRVREVREIYLPYRQGVPRNRFARAAQAGNLWRQINSSVGPARAQMVHDLRARIEALQKLYKDYYGTDYILKRIAQNVFDELLNQVK